MTLTSIAIKNLMRRKAKAAFILAGLVSGIATVVAVVTYTEAMTADINGKLEKYGANILIVPRTDSLPLTYGGMSLGGVSFRIEEIRQADLAGIDSIENAANVAAVGPLVLGTVRVEARRVLMAGVDFAAMKILRPWWQLTGTQPGNDGVVLGSQVASMFSRRLNDNLEINGRHFTVAGILDPTGSQDDNLVFTGIPAAQTILDKEGLVSMAEVAALCKDCPLAEMVSQIGAVLPKARVMAIQQVVKGRMETLAQFQRLSFGICVVVLMVGSLVVLVTMMGSVRERTGEIGVFRAIGFRKGHIVTIIFMEAGMVSLTAGVVGYGAGLAGARAVFYLFLERVIAAPIQWGLMGGVTLLALAMGLLSSMYPALMAARMDPNDALRAL